MKRLGLALILATGLLALPASMAEAAGYSAYVGCSISASAAPSHVCQIGDEPGAYFESPAVDVEYEICIDFPNGEPICLEEQFAEAGVLFVNEITSEVAGNHLVTWYVEDIEVAAWSFRMDAPAPPLPAPTLPSPAPAPAPLAPAPVPAPSSIGCVGNDSDVDFVAHPRSCIVIRHRHGNLEEIRMKNLTWSDWGKARPTARGRWKSCASGSCASGPVKAIASKPVAACGHLAYTRLDVHLVDPDGGTRDSLLKLPAC